MAMNGRPAHSPISKIVATESLIRFGRFGIRCTLGRCHRRIRAQREAFGKERTDAIETG